MRKLPAIIVVVILSFASVAQALKSPAITFGNISVGKFYTVSVPAEASYPDRWPNKWTAGAKLTDETLGHPDALDNWVGWHGQDSVEIVVDLGKNYTIQHAKLHCASRTDWGIYYPTTVEIYIKDDIGSDWLAYGQTLLPPPDTPGYSDAWIGVDSNDATARYVKYSMTHSGNHLFIDELEVLGLIENSWKNVPDWGCYHGAFPVEEHGYLVINSFETLVQKKLSMVLWYATMGTCGFASYLGPLWTGRYGLASNLDYEGSRYLEIGWEPENYKTAEDIASGLYDIYFEQWFIESIDYQNRGGNNDPVWIRAMSEMNGAWTFPGNAAAWGGHPLNYRRAWRRMYNIAEQVGAEKHHIFLWSPNGISYPDDPWNAPIEYYPGDGYVDWVGLSVYVQGDNPYPPAIIQPFYDIWSYKPMMISEGAYSTKEGIDPQLWVNDWFDVQYNFPMIKAIVWFNASKHELTQLDPVVLSTYRQRVSHPYFLRQSIAGILDYNADYCINFPDYAAFSSNWTAQGSNYYGDVNGDNSVDMDDLAIIMSNWLD